MAISPELKTPFFQVRDQVHNGWTLIILGAVFLILSALILGFPVASYGGLTLYFGAAILAAGILRIGFSITNRDLLRGWGWMLTLGLIDVAIGVYLLTHLLVAAAVLPIYVGLSLLIGSLTAIGKSFEVKGMGLRGWGWLTVMGAVGAVFSLLMIFNPLFGALNLIWLTALGFLVLGVFNVSLGLQLRSERHRRTPERRAPGAAA